MQVQLLKTAAGYEIVNDERKAGNVIIRKSGEPDDAYEKRAIAEFDNHVESLKPFKSKSDEKIVVKSATISW